MTQKRIQRLLLRQISACSTTVICLSLPHDHSWLREDATVDAIDLVLSGNYAKLLEQLKLGLDPNYSEDGVSLLHYAIVFDQYTVAQLLIDWGANVHRKDIILDESSAELTCILDDEDMRSVIMKKRVAHIVYFQNQIKNNGSE